MEYYTIEEEQVWTGWSLSENKKTLTVWVFNKKTGKLWFTGKFTYKGPITEDQAYLEAMRYQMVENGELPQECATMHIGDVVPLMRALLLPGNPQT